MQVAYRETITSEAQIAHRYHTVVPRTASAVVTVLLQPRSAEEPVPPSARLLAHNCTVAWNPALCSAAASADHNGLSSADIDVLADGVESGLARGPLLSYPMCDVAATIVSVEAISDNQPATLSAAAAAAVRAALEEATPALLEPFMDMVVTVDSAFVGAAVSDLTSHRRAEIQSVEAVEGSGSYNHSKVVAVVLQYVCVVFVLVCWCVGVGVVHGVLLVGADVGCNIA